MAPTNPSDPTLGIPQGFRSVVGLGDTPRTIAGRYKLGTALGAGGCGEVFRGKDLLKGGTVAVKVLSPMSTEQLARVRREIAALRILHLPGVVRLIDDGVDDGDHFIVMELVEGTRFPGEGTDGTWATVGPRAVRLLEALALVHTAGIIHRDLKPANVLVDDKGKPTILDFGIARGPALGETITTRTKLLGTPRYLAPEQLCGHATDARADLYAVGVMLFEALTGKPPHPPGDLSELYAARVTRDAPSIHAYLPDIPRRVGLLIDRLLARRPEERPRSAVEALADLGEEATLGGAANRMPRLGSTRVVDQLVEAGLAGRSLTLAGARGSGRSRALKDAAERISEAGRRVAWTVPGARPFESLVPLLGQAPRTVDPGPMLRVRLEELFAEGLVLMVDGVERLDRWSARLLASMDGTILRSGDDGDGIDLPDLSQADLQPLFLGPDRLLHLQEDGARELYTRAGGLPARVTAEVGAWVTAGLAEWRDGRVAIGRAALEQLASGLQVAIPLMPDGERPARLAAPLEELVGWVAMAWPDTSRDILEAATGVPAWELNVELDELVRMGALRVLPDGRLRAAVPDTRSEWPDERRRAAHRALAAALPAGNPRRFAHLVACADFEDAARESLLLARVHGREAKAGLAAGVAMLGLSVARQVEGVPFEAELLEEVVIDALRSWAVGPCESALYELSRSKVDSPRLAALAQLLRGSLDVWRGKAEAAMAAVREVPPLEDEELERWRQIVHVHVAAGWSPARYEQVLDEVEPWSHANPNRETLYTGWLGLLRYRQGRFQEAAALHLRAARAREDRSSRLSAMLNGAAALVEAYEPEEAAELAREALELARSCRLESFEARAEWVLRNAEWRLGRATTPDQELIDAVASLHQPAIEAQICLTEAAVAWRAGLDAEAARIAAAARATWTTTGFVAGATLAEALEVVCSGDTDPARIRAMAGRAMRGTAPRLTLQTLGLLARAAPKLAPTWAGEAERIANLTDRAHWSRRNEVLAIEEALSYCRQTPGSPA